jgi:hypothetical protein
VQITGGLHMFGDQGSMLVGRLRLAGLDRGGQPPVQLGAIRFELWILATSREGLGAADEQLWLVG